MITAKDATLGSATWAESDHRGVVDPQVEADHQGGEGHLAEAGRQAATDLHCIADRHSAVVEGMAGVFLMIYPTRMGDCCSNATLCLLVCLFVCTTHSLPSVL